MYYKLGCQEQILAYFQEQHQVGSIFLLPNGLKGTVVWAETKCKPSIGR
jgi:hypothetical protein